MTELYDKDFNRAVDRFLQTGRLKGSEWENMTPLQRDIIKVIDRSFSRIKRTYDNHNDYAQRRASESVE